nr:MAG: hypothetical protein [Bacteriophage sp.]
MKEIIIKTLKLLFVVMYAWGLGLIVWKLGIQSPIEMWNAGNYGLAIVQGFLVWRYVLTLGGNLK